MSGRLANASAFTGFMLAALTPWGYARSWWVLTKAIVTVVQLVLGIGVLSAGPDADDLPLMAGMITGLAFQAWLSVARPWGRTPWARRALAARPPSGSRRMFAWSILIPWLGARAGLALGRPMPVLSLGMTVGYAALRGRRIATRKQTA